MIDISKSDLTKDKFFITENERERGGREGREGGGRQSDSKRIIE